jgi:predicted MFS family arabinose efflux permease
LESTVHEGVDELVVADAFARDRATWLSYLMLGYFSFLIATLGPLMPSLRSELGFSYAVASLHFSALAVGFIVAGAVGVPLARRWGRRKTFWRGTACATAGALLLIMSPVWVGTVLAALIMGSFGALMGIAAQANLAEQHGRHRTIALTEANVIASASAMLGTIAIGVFERTALGWRGAIAAAIVWCVVLTLTFRSEPGEQQLPPGPGRTSHHGRLPRQFWAYTAVLFFSVAVEWCIAFWGADFLTRSAGLEKSLAAGAMSAFYVAMVVGRMTGSLLARRYAAPVMLFAALGFVSAVLPVYWLAGNPIVALIALMLVGLGVANVFPFTYTAALETAPGRAELVTARMSMVGGSSILIAPLALGLLADRFGIERSFGATLLFCFAAFVVVVGMRVKRS